MDGRDRIRAFDWLKGLAVLLMIQTHTLVLLRSDLRGDPLFHRLNWLDGLVAPSFILTSGFALALVQVRAAAVGPEERWRRVRRSWLRIGEVLLAASLLTWCWFDVLREPWRLLRLDILQCIGLSLATAMCLFVPLARRPPLLAAISAAIGVAVLAATPLVWSARSGVAAGFLTETRGSLFPVFPWSGYVFLGGALGAVAAGGARRLVLGLAGLGAIGWLLLRASTRLAPRWPGLRIWLAGSHGERVLVVCAAAGVLLAAERWLPHGARRGRELRFVERLGTSSLAAYFGHEVMLFKRIGGVSAETAFGQRFAWPTYWLATLVLVALTSGYVRVVAEIRERAGRWSARLSRKPATQLGAVR